MAERHPSRTILLGPKPDAGKNRIDATVTLECYTVPGSERNICSEVIELELHGMRAKAPASIVEPLLITDLPVFLRWRGEPPWGSPELDQLVGAHRPAHRRLDGVGRPAVSVHASRRAVRAHCGVRHRLVAHVALARAARVALARHRGRRHDPRARHAGAGAPARRLAAFAARPRRHRARRGRVRAPRGHRPRRRSRRRSRRATRLRRATCSRTSSTASPATRSTRPRFARSRKESEPPARRTDDARRARGAVPLAAAGVPPGCRRRSRATASSVATRAGGVRERCAQAAQLPRHRHARGVGVADRRQCRARCAPPQARARRAARDVVERARTGAAARSPDRAAARDRLSPLLRRPRLCERSPRRSRSARARSARH